MGLVDQNFERVVQDLGGDPPKANRNAYVIWGRRRKGPEKGV